MSAVPIISYFSWHIYGFMRNIIPLLNATFYMVILQKTVYFIEYYSIAIHLNPDHLSFEQRQNFDPRQNFTDPRYPRRHFDPRHLLNTPKFYGPAATTPTTPKCDSRHPRTHAIHAI